MALLQDQGRVQPASLAHILPDRSRVRVGYRQSSPPCLDGRHFGHFRERTSVLGSGAANSRSRSLSHSFSVPGECATERTGRARDASGPENARSDSYHVAWRWCRFYRSRGLNCHGGRCTRRHAALYFCTTIPKTKREPWSRGRPRRDTDVCRPQFTMSCFSASAASGSPPRRPASWVRAAGARRKTARERRPSAPPPLPQGRGGLLPCRFFFWLGLPPM